MNNGPVRAAMVPVSRRVRAYFGPFDHSMNQAAVFDPGKTRSVSPGRAAGALDRFGGHRKVPGFQRNGNPDAAERE